MRVIGGEFRSRRLKSLPGLNTRPTPDRLRETLFNVLAPSIPGSVFMDLYAGTGAVAIEALSRGARRAILIENNRAAVEVIRENLAALGLEGRAEVLTGKAAKVLERAHADVAFLDPPYELVTEYEISMTALARTEIELVIVQHSSRLTPQEAYGNLRRYRALKQGDNSLSFYRRISTSSTQPLKTEKTKVEITPPATQ
jgi:16S rRNA (guanine966-N2)-methyltransferase